MINSQPSHDWLEIAATHGSTKWVKQFIQNDLPQLVDHSMSPQDFAAAFEEQLSDRNLSTPAKQKNYRSNLVQALKTIDEHHPANALCQEALSLVSPTSEQYREMNDAQRGRLSDRKTQYFTSEVAQQLVDRATQLLDRSEWSEVAAGLAVLIGRRISEILLSKFSLKSPWSLEFREMAKKANTHGLSIEIPTLAPAHKVMDAIDRLQKNLSIDDLKNSVSSRVAKQTVNQKFSHAVAQRCDQHFSDLIPARSDRDNLYTHIFRATYATIASHWFCPVNVPVHQFKAEIQGHFKIAQDGKKLPNYDARANYDDYAIGTPDGNCDGRLGIKLGQVPDLQVIEAFRDKEVQDEPEETHEPATTIKLNVKSMNAIAARATPLLISHDAQEIAIALLVLTGRIPETLTQSNWKEASKFSIQLDSLEIPTLTAANQILSGVQKLKTVKLPLSDGWLDACTALRVRARDIFAGLVELNAFTDLQAIYTQIALFRFCPPNIDDDSFIGAIRGTRSERVYLETTERGAWLDHRNVQVLQRFQSPTPQMQNSDLAPSTDHRSEILVDLDLLRSVCDLVGVDIAGEQGPESAIAELLQWVASIDLVETGMSSADAEKDETAHQPKVTQSSDPEAIHLIQALSNQAQTLALLSTQVETLQTQNRQIQQERDTAIAQAHDAIAAVELQSSQPSPDLALQQELEALRHQNEQLHSRVKHLLLALSGEGDSETMTAPHPQTEIADQPSTPPIQPRETSLKSPVQPRPIRGDAPDNINRIIDAFIAYNNAQFHSDRQLRIAVNPIKSIGKALNATYQPAILSVLKARHDELETLHHRWLLGVRHNATVPNKSEVLKTIARDFLHLNNWQSVEFVG